MTPTVSKETSLVLVRRCAGRPTAYDPAVCQKMIDYFANAQQTAEQRKLTLTAEQGKLTRKERVQQICVELPTFGRFARTIGITVTTLTAWRLYPEFDEACFQARDIQKNFLIQNGLAGFYTPQAFIFVAKNISDMTDRTHMRKRIGIGPRHSRRAAIAGTRSNCAAGARPRTDG